MSEFEMFDRNKLDIKPLSERVHDIDISENIPVDPKHKCECDKQSGDYDELARDIINAKNSGSTVLMMYGAHVIRKGCSLYMIELMRRGLITHFATNGAGSIHDFEFALIGQTCESVAKYISEGQFGLWKETGYLNDAINAGDKEGLGFGEAVGKYIWENDFPNKEQSVLDSIMPNLTQKMEEFAYIEGDRVQVKKLHPCGSKIWEILRLGADVRLRCQGCGRE